MLVRLVSLLLVYLEQRHLKLHTEIIKGQMGLYRPTSPKSIKVSPGMLEILGLKSTKAKWQRSTVQQVEISF